MGKTILVVDDDESILDAISLILEDSGYTIITLSKGNQTIEKAIALTPDLILLDVLMSGSDGRDICKMLKSDERTKAIPVVMISAHPSAKKDLMAYGADDFLAKPFDTDDLLFIAKHFTGS